jgi:hypothetical protein
MGEPPGVPAAYVGSHIPGSIAAPRPYFLSKIFWERFFSDFACREVVPFFQISLAELCPDFSGFRAKMVVRIFLQKMGKFSPVNYAIVPVVWGYGGKAEKFWEIFCEVAA